MTTTPPGFAWLAPAAYTAHTLSCVFSVCLSGSPKEQDVTRHSPSRDGRAPNSGNLRGRASVQLVIPRSKEPLPRRLRSVRGLRAQDHFLPLLVSATLLTTLALVCIAYFSLRADVLTSQQQQVSRDVRIAANMLSGPGATLALTDGKLVTVSPSGQAVALAATTQVDSIRALTGERYALYQLQGTGLVAVAANGFGTVGAAAPTQAYDTLIADCGPLAPSSCHQAFSGTSRSPMAPILRHLRPSSTPTLGSSARLPLPSHNLSRSRPRRSSPSCCSSSGCS